MTLTNSIAEQVSLSLTWSQISEDRSVHDVAHIMFLTDDLNSQILDLQEANESSVDEIKAAENKIKQLAGDNETLRATQASSMRDLEDENRHLKHEVRP